MKKIISSFLILSIFANTTGVYAGRKKSKSIRKKDNTETQTHSKQETQQDTGLRPVTCMEKYNICMDKVCVNTQGLRYNCSTSLNSFESVNIEGENFRIGDDLYTFAKGLCSSTIKSCNLKEQNHIQTQYIAKIQEDLLSKNYFDAINAESDETQTALLQEYINCMAPLCGTNFKDCFTIKNIERRSPNCENILASSAKPLSVKKMFFDEIKKQRKDFCAKRDGYIDYQTKVCKVKVVFGNPEIIETEQGAFYGGIAKEVASKYVNVGEMV